MIIIGNCSYCNYEITEKYCENCPNCKRLILLESHQLRADGFNIETLENFLRKTKYLNGENETIIAINEYYIVGNRDKISRVFNSACISYREAIKIWGIPKIKNGDGSCITIFSVNKELNPFGYIGKIYK